MKNYKAEIIDFPSDVIRGTDSVFNYFAWPTVVRTDDGRIIAGASGFRKRHCDPYGKAVIAESSDGGRTYGIPRAVIDTRLDDRDTGILSFGGNGLIVTTFNNAVSYQRRQALWVGDNRERDSVLTYLDGITPAEEERDRGSLFRISFDGGKSFGDIHKSPITSPHGPNKLKNGDILWLGACWNPSRVVEQHGIECWKLDVNNGKMEMLGAIAPVIDDDGEFLYNTEPHFIELENGDLLCHIRAEKQKTEFYKFTLYQSISNDGGKTWSKPVQILSDIGGAPAHIMRHSSGVLISVFGYREMPFEIRAIISDDEGKTWSKPLTLHTDCVSPDMGYPSSVELDNGDILTVYYGHERPELPAMIRQVRWKLV